jgi:ubiquinone/menaquinone biosynthesis C-methylase UbiE
VKSSPTVESPRAANASQRSDSAESCPSSAAQGYERWAPIYDHSPNPLLAREERYLLPLLLNLRSKRILDLACGTGRWLEKLTGQSDGESAVGIDCSVAMLRVAGKKAALAGRLTGAACESLPFRDAEFDLAICSFALGHIQDLRLMVRELARVTRPGADLYITDLHPDAYERGWRVGFRDDGAAVQIEMLSRASEEIVESFHSNGFDWLAQSPLWLEEPERPIFMRAGKGDSFANACQVPAVLVFHFRRIESPSDCRSAS